MVAGGTTHIPVRRPPGSRAGLANAKSLFGSSLSLTPRLPRGASRKRESKYVPDAFVPTIC